MRGERRRSGTHTLTARDPERPRVPPSAATTTLNRSTSSAEWLCCGGVRGGRGAEHGGKGGGDWVVGEDVCFDVYIVSVCQRVWICCSASVWVF